MASLRVGAAPAKKAGDLGLAPGMEAGAITTGPGLAPAGGPGVTPVKPANSVDPHEVSGCASDYFPALESLRASWFDAPDVAARQTICAEIQRVALDEVAYIPLGSYSSFTALRSNLADRVNGFALFWNLRRI